MPIDPKAVSTNCGFMAIVLAAVFGLGCATEDSPAAPSSSVAPLTPGRADVTIAADGVTLGGILFRPNTAEPRPAIIVLHGWQPAGTNGAALVAGRAARYSDDGYVALALSMRGWPPAGGTDDCGLRQPDDVARAAAWLRGQSGVIPDRVGIVGFSQGGQVALLSGSRDASVRAIVAYYPVTDVMGWKSTTANPDIPGYITTVCEPGGADRRSPLANVAHLRAPVMLVHGDQDTRVPTEQSLRLNMERTRLGLPTDLVLVPGAQHGFTATEEEIARPAVDAFLARHLR
jgi:dipeptidyl aminopeptidase/acylaminoacyl peptidase